MCDARYSPSFTGSSSAYSYQLSKIESAITVAEAKVTVWPGKLPKPTSDRVQGGTFIPVTAPAKPKTEPNGA